MEESKRRYDVYIRYDGEDLYYYDDTVEASLKQMAKLTEGVKRAYNLADIMALEVTTDSREED